MGNTHSKIIAEAGKAHLAPLGFSRKGQSRLWIADRCSWLNIVEFTPSGFSKSVSLMNGAHWLWTGMGVISFDEVISSTCHAEYEDDDQFREALDTIAEVARTKALEIEARFASFDAIAKFVVERARAAPDREATGWWGYEAGIVSGLTSAWKDAGYFLQGVTDKRVRSYADELTPLIGNEKAFTKKVNDLVKQQRQALKLNPLPSEPF